MTGEVWSGEQPWKAMVDVGPERAEGHVRRAWPDLADAPLEPLGIGWDNTVYRLGTERVVRFPHRPIAAGLIEVEWPLLRAIAPRLPLAIPRPERIGGPFDDYPWRFVLCDYLPGRPSCAVGLDAAQRAAACEPLARFLAALHGLPLSDPAVAAAPEDELDRMLPSVRIARAERDIGRALGAGLIDDGTPFERILAALPATWRPGTRALVHGDLYARHLLVDDDGRPCAVIDWGDVHRGEPALDLSFPACFLPPGSRRAFERHYGAIDDGDWAAARMKGVQHALNIGLFGLEVRDHDLAAEARRSLDHLAADAD